MARSAGLLWPTNHLLQPFRPVAKGRSDALRYAIEDLRIPKAFGAWLQVGDERFDSSEIQRLYEAEDYPLRKAE
jgi:hypothetical protein